MRIILSREITVTSGSAERAVWTGTIVFFSEIVMKMFLFILGFLTHVSKSLLVGPELC